MNITETERVRIKSEGVKRRTAYEGAHPSEAIKFRPQFGEAIEKKRRRKA